jgi:hypothetical protein
MGLSKNTIDNHYRKAQAKIGQILGIAAAINSARAEESQYRSDD